MCPPGGGAWLIAPRRILCGFLGQHSVNLAAPDGLFHTGPFEDTLETVCGGVGYVETNQVVVVLLLLIQPERETEGL